MWGYEINSTVLVNSVRQEEKKRNERKQREILQSDLWTVTSFGCLVALRLAHIWVDTCCLCVRWRSTGANMHAQCPSQWNGLGVRPKTAATLRKSVVEHRCNHPNHRKFIDGPRPSPKPRKLQLCGYISTQTFSDVHGLCEYLFKGKRSLQKKKRFKTHNRLLDSMLNYF